MKTENHNKWNRNFGILNCRLKLEQSEETSKELKARDVSLQMEEVILILNFVYDGSKRKEIACNK